MNKPLASTALLALLVTGMSGIAHAQTATDSVAVPGQPRVSQIDQRLQSQQNRIDAGVKDGQINAKQEMRDDKTDAHVAQELSKDEAKNGGHITKAEQARMNRQLNKNSARIHHQRAKPVTPASATTPAQ